MSQANSYRQHERRAKTERLRLAVLRLERADVERATAKAEVERLSGRLMKLNADAADYERTQGRNQSDGERGV